MTSWYYFDAGRSVGPFLPDALAKLQQAGIIDDQTHVREGDSSQWLLLSEVAADLGWRSSAPPEMPSSVGEDGFYYLDALGQPLGPVSRTELQLLEQNGRITPATLIARSGDNSWRAFSDLLGQTPRSAPSPAPVHRSFRDFMTLMGVTITAYTFYVVPSYSRDMRVITGNSRMEFLPLLILGIVTLGIGLAVLLVIWAFDLEKHGQKNQTSGRYEQLGAHVIGLSLLSFGGWYWSEWPAIVVSAAAGVWSVWLVQKEINLYTPAMKLGS